MSVGVEFIVQAGGIEYILQAENASEMSSWMDVIHQSMDMSEMMEDGDSVSAVWRLVWF